MPRWLSAPLEFEVNSVRRVRSIIASATPEPIRRLVRGIEARASERRLRREYSARSVEEIFSTIWRENRWGSAESRSGAGSELSATRAIREALPRIVRTRNVRTLLDAPCGDFHWMRRVDLGDCRYIGLDIVKSMIEELQRTCARGDRQFIHGNIIDGPLPPADLVLCRDCLFHLTDVQIFAAVEQFRATGARWLLTTTYLDVESNRPGITGGYRDINLMRAPFCFGPPIEVIEEGQMAGSTTIGARRGVGLWEMASVPMLRSA